MPRTLRRFLTLSVALALVFCASPAWAALASGTVWDIRTGGSDTANGGAFDPTQTAGMFTDGAATSANTTAPVFSSASYNFVAGDVGAWLYISSGTNWTPGWYQIASVASNKATLTATIGSAFLAQQKVPTSASTAAGCATVASPTAATWTIDYSQQNAAQFTYSDMASAGAGLTVSSAAHPFGKQQVGNSIRVTGGTNFTAGTYVIASVSGTTATVVGAGNITSGAGASGTGGLGGSLASPGQVMVAKVAGNQVFIASGTYTLTTSSANVSGGIVNESFTGTDFAVSPWWCGWNTNRFLGNLDTTRPLLQVPAASVSSVSIFKSHLINGVIHNINIDGASKTSITCFDLGGENGSNHIQYCKVSNCTTGFNVANAQVHHYFCEATAFSTAGFAVGVNGNSYYCCEAHGGTATGFIHINNPEAVIYFRCWSYGNTGSTSDGFQGGAFSNSEYIECVSRSNGRHGFFGATGSAVRGPTARNCISVSNGGFGYATGVSSSTGFTLWNCADYNSTSGGRDTGSTLIVGTFITLTGDPHTSSTNLTLNNTAGAGASCRAADVPGLVPSGNFTNYGDLGGVQHQDSGGGGNVRRPEVRTGDRRQFKPFPWHWPSDRKTAALRSLSLAP